jgi:CDP-glycerol glycerophosphotransferase (TagB/SpsB family)
MERYIAAAAVRRDQAALVGFPKLDGLLRGEWHPQAVRESLGLSPDLETVLYAPTFSMASSLHLAGEAIIETVLDSGRSVIVKLHDRSLEIDPERTGGIDWPARLRRFERHPRYALARGADVSPLLAAADVLVTDHSTVGFEFALLDRPIVVYDAPDLKRVARISDGKWALLRSMADVVATPADLRSAMDRALADPGRLADARHAARALFAHAGHATERALSEVYGLLELPPPADSLVADPAHTGAAASVRRAPRLEVHG